MNAPAIRTLQIALVLSIAGLVGASLTGCGAPRVHEVYRLSAAEPWSGNAAAPRQLTAAQADLRQLALNAQQLQLPRVRAASLRLDASPLPGQLSLGPSSLHGCMPGDIAEFTIRSASPSVARQAIGVPLALVDTAPAARW